jgi:FkbM family methyltransferase
MLKRLLLVPLLIASLPCFCAIDFWTTDYHVGFSYLGDDTAVDNVCHSFIAWGRGSYEEPSCESVASALSHARAFFSAGDQFGASLLLCHCKHLWLPTAGASLEHALLSSNLLGMSLWESTHFSGARVAFNMADSIMSKITSAGGDCWAIEVDSLDSKETLMPAAAAVLLNAARVAADSWDFATAQDFIERSKIRSNFGLPVSQEHASSAAKSRASMLDYSQKIVTLQEKSGLLRHMAPLVNHALNFSFMVRQLRESPENAIMAAPALLSFSPETNFTYSKWPEHIVEGIIRDLVAVIDSSASNSAIEAAVSAMNALISMNEEDKSSTHCRLAVRARTVDTLLHLVTSSRTQNSQRYHLVATAISALEHLIKCDGALSFSTAYGIEVMSDLIRNGSKAERMSASKLMKDIVKNLNSLIERSLIQNHAIHRTVFRITLGMAPLEIYHRQQSGSSLKAETALIKYLIKKSRFFAVYWNQLASIMNFKHSLLADGAHAATNAHELIILRTKHESTHARLAWIHSGAQAALVSFFGSEEEASEYVLESIPEKDRLKFNAAPTQMGDPGEYDPSGTLEHFGAESNHRDVLFNPPCSGLATNLLQCWFFKASNNLPQADCEDAALLTCHHFNGKKDWVTFGEANISVPDFSTEVVARNGIMHFHLLDLYFTTSLSVYGEWSALESDLIARHIPVGGTFLDIGGHVGTISAAIAQHVGPTGKVIAVEVQSNFCEMMARTASANSMTQLTVVNAAIDVSNSMCVTAAVSSAIAMPTNFGGFEVSGCKQYQKRLMLSKEQRSSPSPTFCSDFGAKEAVVNSVTIDSLVKVHGLTSLHAIKLDCEGAEHLALQGGLKALKQFSPAIFFEDNGIEYDLQTKNANRPYVPTSEKMRVLHTALLQPLGYVCTQQQVSVFNPKNFHKRSDNIFGLQASVVIECRVQTGGSEM